jgi:hypothetical protein
MIQSVSQGFHSIVFSSNRQIPAMFIIRRGRHGGGKTTAVGQRRSRPLVVTKLQQRRQPKSSLRRPQLTFSSDSVRATDAVVEALRK